MAAFGILVDRHHARALNVAYRLLGDAESARDVAQESFLRLLKAARRYEARGRFTTYLYTIVRNLTREIHRRRGRHPETPLTAEVSGSAVAGRTPDLPDDRREQEDRRRRVWNAIQGLPEDQRAAFVLSELEGLSYADIARVCKCPEGTVASRKHKAIVALRRQLAREEIGS